VLWDGIDDFMDATFVYAQPEFIYMVMRQVTWTNGMYMVDGGAIATGIIQQEGTTPQIRVYAGSASSNSADLAVNTWGILRVLFNGASSKLIVDGNTPIAGDFGALDMGGITIGASGGGAANWANIEVKEVVARNIADTAPNEAIIYDYLKSKYSL
jgi:hypothetical protein